MSQLVQTGRVNCEVAHLSEGNSIDQVHQEIRGVRLIFEGISTRIEMLWGGREAGNEFLDEGSSLLFVL